MKAKRKPSERTLFERWYRDAYGAHAAWIRKQRQSNGYDGELLDLRWEGWIRRAELIRGVRHGT